MSENINVQVNAYLDEKSEEGLYAKLRSYNIDKEMNYVVAVLKLLITNSETKNNNELDINILPKIHYVSPFITKNLAEEYIKELSNKDKIVMLLAVEKGEIVIKLEDMDLIMERIRNCDRNKNAEFGEMSTKSIYNIIAYNWSSFSEEQKDEYAFKLGGLKGCKEVKSLLDNWKIN